MNPGMRAPSRPQLIGRDDAMTTLSAFLRAAPGVVVVWGAPGVGKSSLIAATVGRRAATWWRLRALAAPRAESPEVLAAWLLQTAYGVEQGGDDPVSALGARVGRGGEQILVLDSAEVVAVSLAPLLTRLVPLAPRARFVIGTRVMMSSPGSRALHLPPLDAAAAAALFVACAAQRAPEPRLDAADPAIRALVTALDGLPLAIVLASGHAGVLTPQQLLTRAEAPFTSPAAPDPLRSSLRRTLEESWELLDAPTRSGLTQLSVFCGAVRLGLVEAVLCIDGAAVLDVARRLRDHCLLERLDGPGGAPSPVARLRLRDLVRRFAVELLARDPAADSAVAARYEHALLNVAEELCRALWRGELFASPSQVDYGELTAAIDRDLERGAPRGARLLTAALPAIEEIEHATRVRAWVARAYAIAPTSALAVAQVERHWRDGRPTLARALTEATAPAFADADPLTRARFAAARTLEQLVGSAPVQALADEALALLATLPDDDAVVATRLDVLARLAGYLGEQNAVEALWATLERGRAVATRAGHRRAEVMFLINEAVAHMKRHRFTEALPLLRRALALARRHRLRQRQLIALVNLAEAHIAIEEEDVAEPLLAEALQVVEALGDTVQQGRILGLLGAVHHARGRLPEARACYDDADERLATPRSQLDWALLQMCLGSLASELGLGVAHRHFASAQRVFEALDAPLLLRALEIHRLLTPRPHGDAPSPADLADLTARAHALHGACPPPPPGRPDRRHHVDFALRLAVSVLARQAAPAAHVGERPRLQVDVTGSWFALEGAEPVSLGRRGAARRILAHLARHAARDPGHSSTPEVLFEVGWPREHLQLEHARNRLYVAVAALRKLGLGALLEHDGEGYRLAPTVEVLTVARGGSCRQRRR